MSEHRCQIAIIADVSTVEITERDCELIMDAGVPTTRPITIKVTARFFKRRSTRGCLHQAGPVCGQQVLAGRSASSSSKPHWPAFATSDLTRTASGSSRGVDRRGVHFQGSALRRCCDIGRHVFGNRNSTQRRFMRDVVGNQEASVGVGGHGVRAVD
jgi:hypothetical protein